MVKGGRTWPNVAHTSGGQTWPNVANRGPMGEGGGDRCKLNVVLVIELQEYRVRVSGIGDNRRLLHCVTVFHPPHRLDGTQLRLVQSHGASPPATYRLLQLPCTLCRTPVGSPDTFDSEIS